MLTRPISSACCASYWRHRNQISLAFFGPTSRDRTDGAVAAVERADLRAGLAEAGVVGRDRQVAHDVEHVAAADGVAGDHGDDRLRRAPDLHVEVGDVEAADALLAERVVADVARVAPDPLVAAGAERLVALAGEDDHADVGILPGQRRAPATARSRSAGGRRCAPRAGRS